MDPERRRELLARLGVTEPITNPAELAARLRKEQMEYYKTSNGTYTVDFGEGEQEKYPYSELIVELDADRGCS